MHSSGERTSASNGIHEFLIVCSSLWNCLSPATMALTNLDKVIKEIPNTFRISSYTFT